MSLQKCGLNVNNKNKELQPHGTAAFPCAGYESALSNSITDLIPWHWHEELEIIYITKGTLELHVLSECFTIHKGELAVINANALHSVTGAPYGKLQSLVFSPLLITGGLDSAIAVKYISPLISCPCFSCILLKDQNSAARQFSEAFAALKNDTFGYELTVREQLSHILLHVYQKLEPCLNETNETKNPSSIRTAKMLAYIQQHFSENITLSNISQAASISEREVLRCFKRTIGESPIQYLLKYRLIQSASMLRDAPEKNISGIAAECGFESPAYYTKKFREFYLCTPREYRQNL